MNAFAGTFDVELYEADDVRTVELPVDERRRTSVMGDRPVACPSC